MHLPQFVPIRGPANAGQGTVPSLPHLSRKSLWSENVCREFDFGTNDFTACTALENFLTLSLTLSNSSDSDEVGDKTSVWAQSV